jgi:hypothetical protein
MNDSKHRIRSTKPAAEVRVRGYGILGTAMLVLGGLVVATPSGVRAQAPSPAHVQVQEPGSGPMGQSGHASAGSNAASAPVRTPPVTNPDNMPIKRPQHTTQDPISHPIPGSASVAK